MFGRHFTSQLLPFCFGTVNSVQNHLGGPLLDLSYCVHVVLVLGSPKLDGVLQMRSHKSWIDRNSHFLWPDGCFTSVSQHAVGILGMDALLVHIQLVYQHLHMSFYAKLLSSQSVPQPVLVPGITPSQGTRFCVCVC